ncbi:phospho-acceptor domain-containing protein [Vogesella indigofera]|uniref:histidine kinase n=1 Tax=Vogesella indigofera TaxID=45465 RepID=A0A495BIX5_VOGIN|nr:cache domain-containing protein [Vogesella indigofera]RKQ61297.1 phospho-acceptor domain-containing protein [Vogesella indigofera]
MPVLGRVAGLWRRLLQPLNRSVRTRFVTLALLPLVVGFPVLLLLLAGWGGAAFEELLVFKVRSDLAVAATYFERVQSDVGRSIEALASSEALADTRRQPRASSPDALLRERARSLGLDYLLLLDARQQVVAASLPASHGLRYPQPAVVLAASSGTQRATLDVFSPAQLAALSPQLQVRSHIELLATPGARPSRRNVSDNGLLLHAAAKVPGQPLVLVGGVLLNRNIEFIDRIRHLVYPQGSLPIRSRGSATLFLDDTRIATTVTYPRGGRAIGSRVSQEVSEQVLGRGQAWLNRARVIGDWYVSGYQPLLDSRGQRIGMLYVGFLEQPFVLAKWMALAVLFVLFAITMAAATWVSWRFARSVIAPVERLRQTMSAVAAGRLDARVGALPQQDELALLAAHFDALLARLESQNQAMLRWAGELDDKVAERTRELAAANHTLLSAQQQLFKSEKLAAIGQLAAGTAHEINNPVAVIQGNLELMQELLGEAAAPVLPEIRLMREQVQRIQLIVAKLLQYARPSEYAGDLQQVQPPEVFQDSLLLVGYQMNRGNIAVVKQWHSRATLLTNRFELQQILINLILNAIQAMPQGGVLTLSAHDASGSDGRPGLRLSVADNGSGIAEADMVRLFDPFFTSKHDGTGLGLWVCQGLAERSGGVIEAANQPQGGAVFSVWLPCEPALAAVGLAVL